VLDALVSLGMLADAAIPGTLLVASLTWTTFWGRKMQAASRTRPFGWFNSKVALFVSRFPPLGDEEERLTGCSQQ
jgi:hypothetical protein